jgi:hypothetical protein
MGLGESKTAKAIRIASYIGGLGIMLAFFIFLGRNWDWMIQHNGGLFTGAMLTLAIVITVATFMHMFKLNPIEWLRNRKK